MKQIKLLKSKKIIFAAVGGILLLILAAGIALRPNENADDDTIWREYLVERGDITASLGGGGTLNATGVHHGFDVDLTVEQIFVELGQEVKVGDKLATYSKEKLQDKIDELTDSLEKAQRALTGAKNNKLENTLQKELDNSETGQKDTYEKQKREMENNLLLQEQKIGQLQEQLRTQEQELEAAEDSEDGSVDSAEIQKLKNKLERLQDDLSRLENRNEQNSSQTQIDALVRQRKTLSSQLNTLKSQINEVTGTVNRLKQLKQDLAAAEKQLSEVNTALEGLPEDDPQFSELTTKKAELEAKIAALQTEISELPDDSARLSELISQKAELQQQIDDLNDQIESQEAAADLAADIKRKQEQIADVQATLTALSAKEEKISALKDQIRQTKEDLEAARFELESQQLSLETLNSDHEQALARQQENQKTQEQLDSITVAGLNNAIQDAQDEVDRLREELAEAQALLTTPALTAKADGIVTEVNYTAGEDVPGGRSIVTIGDSGEKHVTTQVAQEDIGRIEVGQTVEMQFVANPDVTLTGRVSKKSLRPTDGGGVTYQVTIDFDEDQPDLMEGMTCNVKFILKKVENVLTLANKAITLRDGKQYVTVKLPDGSHEEREIKTGFSDGRISEVTSGLSEGDTVVVAG